MLWAKSTSHQQKEGTPHLEFPIKIYELKYMQYPQDDNAHKHNDKSYHRIGRLS